MYFHVRMLHFNWNFNLPTLTCFNENFCLKSFSIDLAQFQELRNKNNLELEQNINSY